MNPKTVAVHNQSLLTPNSASAQPPTIGKAPGKRLKPALAVAALLCLASSGFSQLWYTNTLYPGQQAIISFHWDAPPGTFGHPELLPDLLSFNTMLQDTTNAAFPSSGVYALYNGETLLATTNRDGPLGGWSSLSFATPDNPWTDWPRGTGPPTMRMNFSSIWDASIQGRLVLQPIYANPPPYGSIRFTWELELLTPYASRFAYGAPPPIIDSVQIIPGSPVIGAGGLHLSRTNASLSLNSFTGTTYVLEYKHLLSDPVWLPLMAGVPGNGATLILQDTNRPTFSSRFYRVRAY